MKKVFKKVVLLAVAAVLLTSLKASAQLLEWRLTSPTYSAADPDGAGPARGVATFTLQIHTALTGVSLPNVTGMSTGFSWQSSKAMLPTTGTVLPTCGSTSIQQPSNITMAPALAMAGYTYNYVNQCSGTVNFTTGGQIFDRRAAGTVDGGSAITLTNTWMDVFTVTLWGTDVNKPNAGYVTINSGSGGAPGPFPTYAVSDAAANEYVVNSLTFTVPLALPPMVLPVLLTEFATECQPDRTTRISWTTAQEINNNYFDVEKTADGTHWTSVSKMAGAGTSAVQKTYQVTDAQGGAAQYRLKQVDRDGQITYSPTVKTSCEGKNSYVTLYPVPARDVVNLVIGSDKALKTVLQVYDSKGKMVISVPATVSQGINNFKLPVQSLAAGEYFIKGSNSELEISKRFTVVR